MVRRAPFPFPPEPLRDEHECAVLDAAYNVRIPVAGICRGLQIVNIHAGGTLHQDVPSHAGFDSPVPTEWHEVTFDDGTALGRIYGPHLRVTSLPHQTVARVGHNLRITARSRDASVEGLEPANLPPIAGQLDPATKLVERELAVL